MTDVRSRRCVFVSHCLLAQGVMAQGVVRNFPAVVRPVVEFCLDNEINIFQMPCPESMCPAGGLVRQPRGKKWYEENGLRETARKISEDQVRYMHSLKEQGFEILAIIGVELSPACAVNYLNRGTMIYRDEGVYVEELRRCLKNRNMKVNFIGVNQRWQRKLHRDLNSLLSTGDVGQQKQGELDL